MKNLAIGVTGLFATLEASKINIWAASAAGFGTCLWMLVQCVLAIRTHIEQHKAIKAENEALKTTIERIRNRSR